MWSKVTKPTTGNFTRTNPGGRTTFDDSGVLFDSSAVFVDGVNLNAWTKLAKPANVSGTNTILVGMATGLITPPTYATERSITFNNSKWTKVAKPS